MTAQPDLSDRELLIRVDERVQQTKETMDALCVSVADERERVRQLETRMEVAENDIEGIKKKSTQDRWIEKSLTIIGTALGLRFGGSP